MMSSLLTLPSNHNNKTNHTNKLKIRIVRVISDIVLQARGSATPTLNKNR